MLYLLHDILRRDTTEHACVDALLEGLEPCEVQLIHGLWPTENKRRQTTIYRGKGGEERGWERRRRVHQDVPAGK